MVVEAVDCVSASQEIGVELPQIKFHLYVVRVDQGHHQHLPVVAEPHLRTKIFCSFTHFLRLVLDVESLRQLVVDLH